MIIQGAFIPVFKVQRAKLHEHQSLGRKKEIGEENWVGSSWWDHLVEVSKPLFSGVDIGLIFWEDQCGRRGRRCAFPATSRRGLNWSRVVTSSVVAPYGLCVFCSCLVSYLPSLLVSSFNFATFHLSKKITEGFFFIFYFHFSSTS